MQKKNGYLEIVGSALEKHGFTYKMDKYEKNS